jgi:hypothetical protein
MKINDLFKRLENVGTDENNEKREIAEYLAQTPDFKDELQMYYIMLKNKKIHDYFSYYDLVGSNEVSPSDAYVYLMRPTYTTGDISTHSVAYFYPFLSKEPFLVEAYLSKLGFKNFYAYIVPATGLKYMAVVGHFLGINCLVVEVVNINTAVTNTNLQRIIDTVLRRSLSEKYVHNYEIERITTQLASQRLFVGYYFYEARRIVEKYYEHNDTSLIVDIEAIRDAYNRIFQPYRVVYDLNTKQFIPT